MRLRFCLSVVVVSLTVAFSAPLASGGTAVAATVRGTAVAATVRGNVAGAEGYTLLAMSRTRIVAMRKLPRSGRFSVKVGRDVTLQLLGRNHVFFGPIVVAHAAGRAYEALAGHNLVLGVIRLRAGYAVPSKHISTRAVDRNVWARADRVGKPVGAGNLGLLVRQRQARARMAAASQGGSNAGPLPAGGDPTHVGIVTAFNADVTGAGVPNNENAASAQASGNGLFTEIFQPLEMSVNADAVGVTPAQISDIVKHELRLNLYLDRHAAGGASVSGVTVDCGTVVYCASGTGTATVTNPGNPTGARWDGTVPANPNKPGIFSTQIAPTVGTDQIHPGDVFLVHFMTPGGDVVQPTTLTTYFLTAPAMASYDAGGGAQPVSYPVAPGAPGTMGNPIRMSSGKLTLSLWRPQRAALPGETGSFYDIGHLHYGLPISTQSGQASCGAQFFSGLSPTLQVDQSSQALQDSAADAPANSGARIGFTLDLASCLAAQGASTSAPINLKLSAVDAVRQGGTDSSVQTFSVCPPGCDPTLGQGLGPGGQPGPGSGPNPGGQPGPGPGPGAPVAPARRR
jgi:hypothetical protein